jgi:Sel1 repeat
MNDFKKCPYCAEEIKVAAKKCKHCSEWLEKNDNIPTETSNDNIQAEISQAPSSNITKKTKEIYTKHKLVVYLIFGVLAVLVLAVLALSFYSNHSKSTTENYFKLGLKCYSIEDYKEAVKWFRKAAEQGQTDAQYSLGECYYEGNGIARDDKEAVKWFRKAAEQGQADAQYSLGECYYEGNGVARDNIEAFKWFRKAAEQGQADAQYYIAECYYYGNVLAKDTEEALKLYRKAAKQGNEGAIKMLRKLRRSQNIDNRRSGNYR